MAIVVKVTTPKTARVHAQPVHPVIVTPGDGARVAVVAVPGPPGPPGDADLSPEEMAEVADSAAEQVLADLEPPVTLTLLFENGLA